MPEPEEDTIITVLVFIDPQKKSAAQPATPYSAQDITISLKNAAVIGLNGIMAYGKDDLAPAGIIHNPHFAIIDGLVIVSTGKRIVNVPVRNDNGELCGAAVNSRVIHSSIHSGMRTAQTETLV
jgi:glyceraldehyde-3-phosphate dehydrogenase/erythrose-4-phosphate dehydrogenase